MGCTLFLPTYIRLKTESTFPSTYFHHSNGNCLRMYFYLYFENNLPSTYIKVCSTVNRDKIEMKIFQTLIDKLPI